MIEMFGLFWGNLEGRPCHCWTELETFPYSTEFFVQNRSEGESVLFAMCECVSDAMRKVYEI